MANSTGALALLQAYSDEDSDLESELGTKPGTSDRLGLASEGKNDEKTQDIEDRERTDSCEQNPKLVSNDTIPQLDPAEGTTVEMNEVDDIKVIIPEGESVLRVEDCTEYRKAAEDTCSDSDTTDSESDVAENETSPAVEEIHDVSDDEHEKNNRNRKQKSNPKPRTIAEDLGLDDLPPLQDLQITVREEECIPIGSVSKTIQQLVLVTANKGTPAIDLESVLFLDRGHIVLGRVLDVVGPVNEPVYIVRFNSAEEIHDKGIAEGMPVYYAPRTPHTTFVFLDQLMKMKGSDASWENDVEPPAEHLDYSDDEQERNAKHALRNARKANAQQDGSAPEARPKKKPVRRGPRPAQSQGNPRAAHPPNPFYLRPPGFPPFPPQHPGYYTGGPYLPPPMGAVPGAPMHSYPSQQPQGQGYPYMGPPHTWTGWSAPQYLPMPPPPASSTHPHWYPPRPSGPPPEDK